MNRLIQRDGFTVEQLIQALQAYPPTAKVILSSDEEGNDFGLLWATEQDEMHNVILWPASGTVEMG